MLTLTLLAQLAGQGMYEARGGFYAPLASYMQHTVRYTFGGSLLDPALGAWRVYAGVTYLATRYRQFDRNRLRTSFPWGVHLLFRPDGVVFQAGFQEDEAVYRFEDGREDRVRFRRFTLGSHVSDRFFFQVERFEYRSSLLRRSLSRVENVLSLGLRNRWGAHRLVQDLLVRHVRERGDNLQAFYKVVYARPWFQGDFWLGGLVWADRQAITLQAWSTWQRALERGGLVRLSAREVWGGGFSHYLSVYHQTPLSSRWSFQERLAVVMPATPETRWVDGRVGVVFEHRTSRMGTRTGFVTSFRAGQILSEGVGAYVMVGPTLDASYRPGRPIPGVFALSASANTGMRFLAFNDRPAPWDLRTRLQWTGHRASSQWTAFVSYQAGEIPYPYNPYRFLGWGMSLRPHPQVSLGWNHHLDRIRMWGQSRGFVRMWDRVGPVSWVFTLAGGWTRGAGIVQGYYETELNARFRVLLFDGDLRAWVRRQGGKNYWGGDLGMRTPFGRL